MKTRNVNLQNTPLLTNNICKCIHLVAPSLPELKKKVKEYEILLIRALTNAYKLSHLTLDKNGSYAILPDGNYQSSIYLNFSGTKKEEAKNPERTLEYIKHLTAMESKKTQENIIMPLHKHETRDYHKTITVPIELEPGDIEIDAVSRKQEQILEQLIKDTNLIDVKFFMINQKQASELNTTTLSLKVEYDCREIIEIPIEHSNPDEQENR